MHPVLKRILINGGLTAAILAGLGLLFAEVAGNWDAVDAGARPGSAHLNKPADTSFRYQIPLTMAFWGFVFVAGWELIVWRIRGTPQPPKSPEARPDSAEKLLNDLLAQAEARGQESGIRSQESGNRGETEDRKQETGKTS